MMTLETFLAKKRLELLVNPYADRVMARIEQDGLLMEESGKKEKSVNVTKGRGQFLEKVFQ